MTTYGYSLALRLPRVDVTIRAGQELDLTLPVLDADGVAVDSVLIGSARAQVRSGPLGGDLLFEFEGAAATVVAGGVRFTATPEQTAAWSLAWPAAGAWWDHEATDTGGAPHPLTSPGKLLILPRITR